MPAKGGKLTEEHREKLAKAQAKANAERHAVDAESREMGTQMAEDAELQKALNQEEALRRSEEIRAQMLAEADKGSGRDPNIAIHQPSHVPSGAGGRQSVSEWGPYDTYVLAETPYGRYAVEPGYVMFFEQYTYFNSREQRMMTSHRPIYIWYGSGPGAQDEDGNWVTKPDKNYGKTRDEIIYGIGGATRPSERPHVDSQAPASV